MSCSNIGQAEAMADYKPIALLSYAYHEQVNQSVSQSLANSTTEIFAI